ncbi:MAG: dienelactone hydrolase family protein [Desulfovibrio sp.]
MLKFTINHTHNTQQLESTLLLPEGQSPFPAVLMFHEYTGLTSTVEQQALQLVNAGFAVFCADFYGVDERPKNVAEAITAHKVYRNDRALMRERGVHCYETLMKCDDIDSKRISALGFSFGGGAALELARARVLLQNAISIYGYLETSIPIKSQAIKTPIYCLHVDNDPVLPEDAVEQFAHEMDTTASNYTLETIDSVQHGFMNPDNPEYNEALAKTYWAKLISLLND